MPPPDRAAAAAAIDAFLRALGRDPEKEPELAGTGERVATAFLDEVTDGYAVDGAALLAKHALPSRANDLVVMRDVAISTMCPHHLMPAKGVASVAFAPASGGKIVGLGALVQLVDAYAHRLTLQEEIGESVVGALMAALAPVWAGCRVLLEHGCVVARGERRHGARVETIALRGDLGEGRREAAERALRGAA